MRIYSSHPWIPETWSAGKWSNASSLERRALSSQTWQKKWSKEQKKTYGVFLESTSSIFLFNYWVRCYRLFSKWPLWTPRGDSHFSSGNSETALLPWAWSLSVWGHWRDLNKAQFMMFKFIKKRYKMGTQTLECTWNMRINVYSHSLPEAKQHVKFGVLNKQNRENIQHF